jgi:integrase
MTEAHSTAATPRSKPAKPHPDFPLFPHSSGQWAKKIRSKLHYFGVWSDPDAALKKYLQEKDALHAGRKPREASDGTTVKELVNHFLNAKQALVDAGELSPRTWADYKGACDEVVAAFGRARRVDDLAPDDFAALRNRLAKKWGPHRVGKTIQCVRCAFKHALDSGLLAASVRFGPGFKRPSAKVLRLHRAKQGPKLFTAGEVRDLVEGALVVGKDGPELVRSGVQLRAMILLGVNCGFGNADCGNLPRSALDLVRGVIDFPRPKTGIPRRCPLWPATVAALREALAKRKEPKDQAAADLVFVTKYGGSWARDDDPGAITKEFRKLLGALGINGHRNFYALRHTFRTVADGAKDQPAADFIMGHEVPHMSTVYREGIDDARLKAVTDHVRAWLFAERAEAARGEEGGQVE